MSDSVQIGKPEIIDVHLYDPSDYGLYTKIPKTEKAFIEIFHCKLKDSCPIYREGGCVKRELLAFGNRGSCPYSSSEKVIGYSRKASKFYDWVKEIKAKYKDTLFALKAPKEKVYSVGEYYYLPFITLSWCWEASFKSLFTHRFIKKTDLTAEVLTKILTYKPKAIMGGEITDYQNKDIPNLIKSIIRYSPELTEILRETGLNVDLSVPSNVGRKAVLQTLNLNIYVRIKDDRFFWDGTKLKAISRLSVICLLPGEWEVYLTPSSRLEVIIENENQVNENTEFLN